MLKLLKRLVVLIVVAVGIFLFSNANAATLNETKNFYVNTQFDRFGRTNLDAILKHISDKAHFYVDIPYLNRLDTASQSKLIDNLRLLATDFDGKIYPLETEFFGSIPSPGIDGDPKITILVEELVSGNGGYFDLSNVYSKKEISDSNETEMVVISAEAVQLNLNFSKLFLAHEFQHLISVNQKELTRKLTEDKWLNELRSEYGISVSGYNDSLTFSSLTNRKRAFLENPSNSLVEWPNKSEDYAIAALVAEYMVEQFGNEILSSTLKSDYTGINSINKFLVSKSRAENFSDIFANWMTAVYINDSNFDARFGYKKSSLKDLKVTADNLINLSQSLSEYTKNILIKSWQPIWQEINFANVTDNLSKSLQIKIAGHSSQGLIGNYVSYYKDGSRSVSGIPFISSNADFSVLNSEKGLVKVTLLITSGGKTMDFSDSELATAFSVKASLIETEKAKNSMLKDGSLIRKENESEIYVIERGYRRYLSPEVIKLYGHLDSANAVSVTPEVFFSYKPSNYVKYVNAEKVYAIWPQGEGSRGGTSAGIASDNTKHWLDITARQWDDSGRDWGAIFVINDLELNYYKLGENITK